MNNLINSFPQKNNPRHWILVVIGIFILTVFGLGRLSNIIEKSLVTPISQVSESPVSTPVVETSGQLGELIKVARVIDGDTIELVGGARLRYIGIDTPETKHPTQSVECFGQQAYERNKELVEGKMVQLEKDVNETDRYGRLLRYVYIDGVMINEQLVAEGYAEAATFPPDVKYQPRLAKAERKARDEGIGLWGDMCAINRDEASSPQPSVVDTLGISTNSQCQYDCRGEDKDCRDFASQAEAQSFFNCCGFSATTDPMRLDNAKGQGDGVVCESLK